MDFRIGVYHPCVVEYGNNEPEAVKIAAENLKTDLQKIFGVHILHTGQTGNTRICIHTLASSEDTQAENQKAASTLEYIQTGNPEAGQTLEGTQAGNLEVEETWEIPEECRGRMCDKAGAWRKEAYSLWVQEGELYIIGTDRRGTIYGIYDLCERMGVSPWYFWADVPVKKKDEYILPEGYIYCDYPSVEYRGIFINDEEELEAWTKSHMEEDTIGIRTYEKIFELLLRLKGNYIWPAMHVNSFNMKKENGALAEKMGIVVGTSHCDMLMRSNNREWRPWLAQKGYEGAKYDYSLPGRNREILQEYWRESIEQNREFEVCYTLGMRGIHDSGFETASLKEFSGEELKEAKIRLLQQVMTDQCRILKETLGRDTMMTFIPYKEVLPLYDGGLEVPEDITLVWANDNYGHIRRYPSQKEKNRKGGNGIYYHNSYWAPPGMSYVFLCSIPLAHTANELRKAYQEGVRKLWVMNTGAMKPLEQEIEFFLKLAWEIGKEDTGLTDHVDVYVEDWVNRNFSGGIGRDTAKLLNDFSQLTNVRKLEMMDYDAFSQTAYGDEAVVRIHAYEELFAMGNRIYASLPQEEKAAFFQLVLMRIHAAYFTNLAYYYGDRSTLACRQGKFSAAQAYARKTRELEDARRKMLVYYNKIMLDGKWDHILDPEGFPPPRAAMMPVCTPPLWIGGPPGMVITLWNEDMPVYADRWLGEGTTAKAKGQLTFTRPTVKWFEVGNAGKGCVDFVLEAPAWVELSQNSGTTQTECRILVWPKDTIMNRQGVITVTEKNTGNRVEISVCTVDVYGVMGGQNIVESVLHIEDDGMVAVEADCAWSPDFRKIERLGRGCGNLMEAATTVSALSTHLAEEKRDYPLQYDIIFTSEGEFLLEIHRFPSLNSTGQIRIGVSVDDGPVEIADTEAVDEHRGTWRENVRNNVDRLYLKLPYLAAGKHKISFHAIDKYFAFTRFVVYTKKRKENNYAGVTGCQALPVEFDAKQFAQTFYGSISLRPRPVEYACPEKEKDTLAVTDVIRQDEIYGKTVEPEWILQKGRDKFREKEGYICIDCGAAMAQIPYASYTTGTLWEYCASESYGRSGIAMYIRRRDMAESEGGKIHSLNYHCVCQGGEYVIWLLAKFSRKEESVFGLGIDGEVLPKEALYRSGCLWRYEAEQIYRYVPVGKAKLSAGEHLLTFYAKAPGLRFDRICLCREDREAAACEKKKLPPMDCEWEKLQTSKY